MKKLVIRPYAPSDLETWRALLAQPGIVEHFDTFQGPRGLENALADEHLDPAGIRLAFVAGQPVGFAFAYVLPQSGVGWAMMRAGVVRDHRREGIGEALTREVIAFVSEQTRVPHVRTISASSWEPCPGAIAMAAKMGFVHERYFWLMERPRSKRVKVAWPAGTKATVFDGSRAHLEAWNDIYNLSFAHHWRYVPSTIEECIQVTSAPSFRPEGLVLAWRGEICVGFCRCSIFENRGEVEVLGTHPVVRGSGLGRALLRWGVRWLEANTVLPVTLMVDGENVNALRLYLSEGFETKRVRRVWSHLLQRK